MTIENNKRNALLKEATVLGEKLKQIRLESSAIHDRLMLKPNDEVARRRQQEIYDRTQEFIKRLAEVYEELRKTYE